jgi:O-antigen ligase
MSASTVAVGAAPRRRALAQPALDGLFLTSILLVSFAKVQWSFSFDLSIADVLTALFLVAFVWDRVERADGRLPRSSLVGLAFFAAFALVYLAGFYNLDTAEALSFWEKGMVKFVLHFGFLVAGVALLARRDLRFYWYALGAFCGGIALNGVYGLVQLVLAEVGVNLDSILVQPITGRQTDINVFGRIGGTQSVFRPNGLTGDPNHLGIELLVPLLILTPVYLRLEKGHRYKTKLAAFLAFLLVVLLATLSRSAALGLAFGVLVLVIPYRKYLRQRQFLIPLAAVAAFVGLVMLARLHYFLTVLKARTHTGGVGTSTHFTVYGFIPDVLHMHPLLGLGLNNFAVYYEFVTGRPDFGPHSFYVATIVETGLVGVTVFAVFVLWLFRRLGAARRLGRELAALGDPLSARLRPLGWGMTAALVATLAANIFYLTMTFYYFHVFATLAVALPLVFALRKRE